jgi:hypothetical protein
MTRASYRQPVSVRRNCPTPDRCIAYALGPTLLGRSPLITVNGAVPRARVAVDGSPRSWPRRLELDAAPAPHGEAEAGTKRRLGWLREKIAHQRVYESRPEYSRNRGGARLELPAIRRVIRSNVWRAAHGSRLASRGPAFWPMPQ